MERGSFYAITNTLKFKTCGLTALLLIGTMVEAHATNYLSQSQSGTAFRDRDKDGVFDDAEDTAMTDQIGRFRLPAGRGRLYLQGGSDTLAGYPNNHLLTTPKTANSVGILTTIWQALKDRHEPSRKIANLLAVPVTATPAHFSAKPIERLKIGSKAELLLKRDAQLSQLLRVVDALLIAHADQDTRLTFPLVAVNSATGFPEDEIAGALVDSLIEEIQPGKRGWKNIDLTIPDTVKRILVSTLVRLSLPVPADVDLHQTAAAVSALNTIIDETGRANPALFSSLQSRGVALARLVAEGQYARLADMTVGLTPAFTTVWEDTGSSPIDGITHDRRPILRGVVAPEAAKVTVDIGEGPSEATLESGGVWSFRPAKDLADGSYSCTAYGHGADGKQSPPSVPMTLIVDTIAPSEAKVDTLATSDTTPVITGTWDPAGNDLIVTVNGRTYGQSMVKSEGTAWSLQVPADHNLPLGTYDVVTAVIDLAGNKSESTASGVLLVESPLARLFHASAPIHFDQKPYLVKLADFNHDNKLDLAVTGNSNRVSLLLGNGDGSFQPALEAPSDEASPMAMHVGKIDADDDLDLQIFGSSSVLLGNGDGSFYAGPALPVPYVELVELNGDGHPDLITIYGEVYVNDGAGRFAATPDFISPVTGESCPGNFSAAGDLDGDGHNDVVQIGSSGCLGILRGTGDGSLQRTSVFQFTSPPDSLKLSDLNGDDRLDIVIVRGRGTVTVLLNDGHGQYLQPADFGTGYQDDRALAIADFDGDSHPDIVVTGGQFKNSMAFLRNNGGGSFEQPIHYVTGDFPWRIDAGDLNADGKPDLVVANWVSGTVSIFLNQGIGGAGVR